MKKPKMIIFDYGNTLLYEPGFDALRGEEAIFKHVKTNVNNLKVEQIHEFAMKTFSKMSNVRNLGFEFHERQFQRFVYDYLEIEFNIPFSKVERIFWDNASYGAIMPNADKMISYINKANIRTGIISNISFSHLALKDRLNRLLPNNKFEFIISSGEYFFRKPNPFLFELALKKANLDVKDVWFCGDNVEEDIKGCSAVGMFPVWYENKTVVDNPWEVNNNDINLNCEYLHINDWNELIEILENF